MTLLASQTTCLHQFLVHSDEADHACLTHDLCTVSRHSPDIGATRCTNDGELHPSSSSSSFAVDVHVSACCARVHLHETWVLPEVCSMLPETAPHLAVNLAGALADHHAVTRGTQPNCLSLQRGEQHGEAHYTTTRHNTQLASQQTGLWLQGKWLAGGAGPQM
jgi:hypothetical protein